jgi:predicted ATP-grasp superfamily ATP-dependent carboligase
MGGWGIGVRQESFDLDTSAPAVVLKFDPNVMHHGGLGVIRSLGRLGVPVYGVHEGPWAPAATSRYLHGRYYWQPGAEDTERVRAGLLRLAERIGRPAVLIATDDAGAIFLAEHGEELRPWFLFPRPPTELPRQLAGKHSLYQLCRNLAVPCPQATMPDSLHEARQFAAAVGFPLIAKLATPWRSGNGKLRSTSIVTDRGRLDDLYRTLAGDGARLMLQEFIPGGRGHDWFFHGYCDGAATCRPAFTGVKERSYPAHAGLTSLGRSAPNPRLRDEVIGLLARISYSGILDLDLRWDARDDQYKLLDFNPRLGAQFKLFRDPAGIDVVRAQYLDLTGHPIPHGEQVDGRGFLVENYDPISAFRYWRSHELNLRSWMESLRTVDEAAWFAQDDLRPFGLMCLRMGSRLATRPLARRHQSGHGRTEPRFAAGRASTRARRGKLNPPTPSQRTLTIEPRSQSEETGK